MMDMSIPVIVGTIVIEVGVVISSFVFSNYLTRSGEITLNPNSGMKTGSDAFEGDTHSRTPPKKMSYKDEKESYFDFTATATQIKFERNTDEHE